MPVTGVPVQHILFTVFQSIFEVFLLCLAGFVLSYKGIVDKPSSKLLNHINVALFTPALLFSKVAFFLTPSKLRQLWVIPVFFFVITVLSAVIANSLARACRLKRSQVNFATAASMFMNSNSLPVALMQSLVTTVPLLKWDRNDTIDAMFGRSLTYLVLFSTLGMILRWSYGVRLLAQADESELVAAAQPTTYHDVNVNDRRPPLTHGPADRSTTSLIGYEAEADTDPRDQHVWPTRRSRPRLASLSRRLSHPHARHSHLPAVPTSLGDQSESDRSTISDSEDTIALRSGPIDTGFSTEVEDHPPVQAQAPLSSPSPPGPTPRWDQPTRRPLVSRLFGWLKSLSPPLIASIFALVCVLVPPLQRLLKAEDMIPFRNALENAGGCSVPLTMIVLGGWFWDGESKSKQKHTPTREGSDRIGYTKCLGKVKGKNVEKRQTPPPRAQVNNPNPQAPPQASFWPLIGTLGNVLMGRKHAGTRQRVGANAADDVEAGPQSATHTETETEHSEIGSQSRRDSLDGNVPANPSMTTLSPAPEKTPPGETLTVIVTILARMVLVPIVITPLMILISHLGWGGEVFEDPIFIVSSMLLVSSPPALTLAQISQRKKPTTGANRSGADETFSPFERLLSRTIFWAYLVLTPFVTIISVMVGLLLVEA